MARIVQSLAASGIAAELTIQHGLTPTNAIVRKAREIHPDLIVMGAHGHRGVKDLIFGNTINAVRHQVDGAGVGGGRSRHDPPVQ